MRGIHGRMAGQRHVECPHPPQLTYKWRWITIEQHGIELIICEVRQRLGLSCVETRPGGGAEPTHISTPIGEACVKLQMQNIQLDVRGARSALRPSVDPVMPIASVQGVRTQGWQEKEVEATGVASAVPRALMCPHHHQEGLLRQIPTTSTTTTVDRT